MGIVLVAMTTTGVASAAAETPPGPRLGYQHFDSYPDVFLTIGPGGGDVQTLVNFASAALPKPAPIAGLTWSPDGTSFAYAGVLPGGGIGARPQERRIYVAPTNGAPAVEVPGSVGGLEPVFAPDGSSLAALLVRHHARPGRPRPGVRVEQSSIWLLSLDGSVRRQLTPWRQVYDETPWSFEPDGSVLGIIRSVRIGPPSQHRGRGDAFALHLDGSGETRIAKNATGLAFSPDGARVALMRRGRTGDDLWVGTADGGGLRRISDGPGSEESPSWDPSGQRLAFVMAPVPLPQGFTFWGNSLLQINADGTCQTELRVETTGFKILSPSWQPGPGRDAGPIAC